MPSVGIFAKISARLNEKVKETSGSSQFTANGFRSLV